MAFESLTERLQQAMGKIRKKGKVSEADVKEMMREIRLALLEADVNLQVVKDFTKRVRERAVGAEVLESLSPAQQIAIIVPRPSPAFRLVKVHGRSPRMRLVSRSITSSDAPTYGARSVLLITRKSDLVIPGPPLRGIFSPSATSIT